MSAAPLAGVRVVTIALNLPGPVAAARLQELGADIVTVLPPSGDPVATLVPALYEELHRGQSVRTVDMKSQALSLIHISEPTRREWLSRMPSSA